MLSELVSTDSAFPLKVQYQKRARVSADPGLPCDSPLEVRGFISEDAVLAAKIFEQKTFAAFYLPLRTRLTVGVERACGNRKTRDVFVSECDSYAEEVSQDVLNAIGMLLLLQSAQNASRVENRGNISHFWPPAKIGESW